MVKVIGMVCPYRTGHMDNVQYCDRKECAFKEMKYDTMSFAGGLACYISKFRQIFSKKPASELEIKVENGENKEGLLD